jgi:hypothetical protein
MPVLGKSGSVDAVQNKEDHQESGITERLSARGSSTAKRIAALVVVAIRSLRTCDREKLLRFYFRGQTQEVQIEMQLTVTQYRLRKSRSMSRAQKCPDQRIQRNGVNCMCVFFKPLA